MNTTETKEVTTIVTTAKDVPVDAIIRAPSVTRQFIAYDEQTDRASFKPGSGMKPEEFALILSEDCGNVKRGKQRLVFALRLARQLPALKVGEKTVPAYDYICAKMEADCPSHKVWQSTLDMVPIADLVETMDWKCALDTVRDTLGFLRKMKWIDENNKPTQLLLRQKGKPSDPIVLALKDGSAKVSAFRPIVKAAKVAANEAAVKAGRPVVFADVAKKAAAAAVAQATLAPLPASIVTENPPVRNPLLGTDTIAKLSLDLKIIVGRAEKLRVDSESRKAFRAECGQSIAILSRFSDCKS